MMELANQWSIRVVLRGNTHPGKLPRSLVYLLPQKRNERLRIGGQPSVMMSSVQSIRKINENKEAVEIKIELKIKDKTDMKNKTEIKRKIK